MDVNNNRDEIESSSAQRALWSGVGRIVFPSFDVQSSGFPRDCQATTSSSGQPSSTAESVRAAAEDCLRATVPMYCAYHPSYIGLGNAQCVQPLPLPLDTTNGTVKVIITGGVMDFSNADVTSGGGSNGGGSSSLPEQVNACLKIALESIECVQRMRQSFPNTNITSLHYQPETATTPAPTPAAATTISAGISESTSSSSSSGSPPVNSAASTGGGGEKVTHGPMMGGAAAGAAVLVALVVLWAASMRRRQHSAATASSEREDQHTKSIGGSRRSRLSHTKNLEKDLEAGGTMLALHEESLTSPSEDTQQKKHPKQDDNNLQQRLGRIISAAAYSSNTTEQDDTDAQTPTTVKNSSLGSDEAQSFSSSIEEHEEVVRALEDAEYLSSSSSSSGDECDRHLVNDRQGGGNKNCYGYDTRHVMLPPSPLPKPSQTVIIVSHHDNVDDNDQDSPRPATWIRSGLLTPATSLLLSQPSHSLRIQGLAAPSSSYGKMHSKGKEDTELLSSFNNKDDSSTDCGGGGGNSTDDNFEPDQDWNPDDNTVSSFDAAENNGNGELSFSPTKASPLLMLTRSLSSEENMADCTDDYDDDNNEGSEQRRHCMNRTSGNSGSTRSLLEWLRTATTASSTTSTLPRSNHNVTTTTTIPALAALDHLAAPSLESPSPTPALPRHHQKQRRCSTPRVYLR